MAEKKYTLDFEIGKSLKTAIKDIKEFSNEAGNVELSPAAVKQINNVTERVEELAKEIDKVNKTKVDAKQFKAFSDSVKGYVDSINQAFEELKSTFNSLGNIPGIDIVASKLQNICDLSNNTVTQINKIVETTQKTAKIKTPKVDSQISKQAKDANEVLEVTKKTTRAKKEELEITKAENKELEKQSDIVRDLKPKATKRENKKVNTELKREKEKVQETLAEFSDETGNEVDISVVIPKGTDAILKQRINEIVSAINETNPTITVGVRFASDYNTRQRREAIEQLQANINEKLDSIDVLPNTKKAKEQYAQTIEDIRGMLLKELRHDDSDAMFNFSTNVAEVGQQVISTVESVSKALGELPLHANLIFNEEKIREDLHKMKNLSLEITSLDFSKSFIDSLDATEAITQIQGEIDKIQGPEPAKKTDEEIKLEDLLEKVKKVRNLASSIGKNLQPIELKGAFDKDQLQEALNNIAGLILKIDELDVAHIKGTTISGGVVAGNIIANGTANGIIGGNGIVNINQEATTSEDDKKEAVEKSTDANIEATESLKRLTPEMEKFIERAETGAKKLSFNDDGTLSQSSEGRGKIQDFLRKFQGSKFGLVDWAMNTKALGTGDTFINNLKLLEGMQASMAHDSKVAHPKVLVYDENFFKEKKGGGLTKKGNEKALETLFSSMRLYGANKDVEHSASEMLRGIRNKQTRQEVLDLFYAQNPNYANLRNANIQINTPSPEKRQSYKKVLSKEVEQNSKITNDVLDDLNRDVIQYLEVTDEKLESIDKALEDRLKDLQTAETLDNTEEGRRYKALSADYAEQREDFEAKNALGMNIFGQITSMSPESLKDIDEERYPQLARFVSTLQKKYPERWENLNKVRNQKIDEELTRRFKAISLIDDRILESEKNDEAVEKFIDKFFETYPDLDSKGFKDKLSEKTKGTLLDNTSLKKLESSYKEKKDTARLNAMPLDQRIKTLVSRIKLDDKGQVKQTEASAKNIENIFNTLLNEEVIGAEHGIEEAIQKYNIPASIGNALREKQEALNKVTQEEFDKKLLEAKEKSQRSKARVKTSEERRKETETKQKAQEVARRAKKEEQKEVTRREGYDDFFSSAQGLTQKVTSRVSVDNLSENNTIDIQKMLEKYYERLAQIEQLKEKINDYKKRIKETTGEELSDEQVFQEIFPASPENVKSALSGLKKYDEYISEATRLINRISEIEESTNKFYAEQNKPEQLPLAAFTQDSIKSINDITSKLGITKTGALKSTKTNEATLKQFADELVKVLFDNNKDNYKALDISELYEHLDIPGVSDFMNQLQEQRAKERELTNKFDQIVSEMRKTEKGSDEYNKLLAQTEDINKQIQEVQTQKKSIEESRNAYIDNFYQGLSTAYNKKMEELGINMGQGYEEGVKEEESRVKMAVEEVIKAGIEAAKEAQDSHSPSREYYQLGNWAIDGYVDAIKENLPVIKEFASQIKFNPDGTIDQSAENIALANQFIDALKQYGAIRVARVNPFDDWKDNKGLKTLFEELPKTEKTGQVKKSNIETFKPFFEKFLDAYGFDVKNGKGDFTTFDSVMKEMGVGDKDLSILKERFMAYMQQRSTEIANERANIKTIVDSLTKNGDQKTINKKMNVNGDKFKDIYQGYISSYKGAITSKGVNDEVFNKFASDMGLSEDNAQRIKDIFNKLFIEMYSHIDEVRQECNDAAHGIFHEIEDEIKDSGNLESKEIEENKEEALKAIEEEAKAKEKALAKEEKERKQLIEDLGKIQKDTSVYTTTYRERVGEAITNLRNGGNLAEGQDILGLKKEASNRVYKKSEEKYYDIVGGVNRLLSNKTIDSNLRKEVEELAQVLRQLDPAAEMSQEDIAKLNAELKRLQAEADKTGKTFWNTVVERLQKANADFIARYLSIRDLIRYFREFMQTVTELDTALTEMRKVSDESLSSLKEYQKTTFDVASALGTTAVQVQQSTADWMRLGETMEEAAKSAQAATTLLNVSEFENINDATTALVAMSQAYKDLDKTEIIDVLNNIGNNYSIATDQLATALQASSAALMTQGNDLYEAAALVTAGNAIIQDASKTGTGIRTIALRIAGQKLGTEELKEQLDELGEEVDEWVMQTESKKRQAIMEYTRVAANDYQGVDILDANGNLKDTYHILLEISKVYKDIQEEDKKFGTNRAQGLVEELAGKVRSNIAASILMNPQMLEDVYNDALNSMGSAAEENAKYLDSIAGKTQQLKNEWQEFQFNMLDSEFLKNMIDLLKGLLKIVNSLGDKLPIATAALGAFAFALLSVSKGLFVLKSGQLGAIPKLFASMASAIKVFTGAEVVAEEAILATNVALGAQNFLMGTAFVAVLAVAAYGIYKLATHEKELAKAAQEAKDSINQTRDSLKQIEETVEDVGKRYAELAQKVSDVGKATQSQGGLSSDEYKEFLDISNQLAEVFPRLTEGYDANGNALLALDGNVNQITASLEALLEEEKKFADEEILKNADKVYAQQIKEYNKKRKNISAMDKENKHIADKTDYVMSDILSGETVSRGDSIFDVTYERKIRETLKKALGVQNGLDAYLRVLSTQNVLNEKTGRYETISTYDFSQLTEEEIKAIQNYYEDVVLANKKEINKAEREIDQSNKEFSQWMVLSLKDSSKYGNLSKEKQQILENIVGNLDFNKIDDADKGDWDSLTAYIENNFVSAIANLDNKKLEDLLYSKLADTTLDPIEKSEIIEQILTLLTEIDGVTEEHPIYLHFQAAYDEAERQTNEAVQHILGGMVVRAGDTEAIREQRAKDWIKQLDASQFEALMNQPISSNTLNSYEDLLDLLKQIHQETSRYESVGALLSQNVEVADTSWSKIRNELVGLAQAGKLDEQTLRDYKYFNEILQALGLSADVTDEELKGMIDDINKLAVKNAVDDLSNYKNEVEKLNDAYTKYKKGEFIDANTLSALQDAFGDLDSYQAFEQAVLSGQTNLQQYFNNIVTEYANQHKILNELTDANKGWVKQQLIASGITAESADKAVESALKYQKTLENEVRLEVEQLNSNQKIAEGKKELAIDTANLDKVTIQEVAAILAETQATGEGAEKLKFFAIQKELAKMTGIRNNDDIEYLLQICELADIGSEKLNQLKRMNANYDKWSAQEAEAQNKLTALNGKNGPGVEQERAYWNNRLREAKNGMAQVDELKSTALTDVKDKFFEKYKDFEYNMEVGFDFSGVADSAASAGSDAAEAFKDALDKILAMYDAELDAGVVTFQTYVNKSRAIIEEYYRDGKIKASEYYDYLANLYQKQVSEYDKVISAVQRLLKKQTDELQKQKEAIEESYNLQIEEIQKKIDALRDENDEIDKNMALQKAQ